MLGEQGVLLQHNCFAYCGNSPIDRVDHDGQMDAVATSDFIHYAVEAAAKNPQATATLLPFLPNPIVAFFVVLFWPAKTGNSDLPDGWYTGADNYDSLPNTIHFAHRSNARPSTRNRHEEGEARDKRDNEKGDSRRKPNPNKPKGHRKVPPVVTIGISKGLRDLPY